MAEQAPAIASPQPEPLPQESPVVPQRRWNLRPLIMLCTVVSLLALVALPIAFVILQAIFPHITRSSFSEPLSALLPALREPELLGLIKNTALMGMGVVIGSALLAIPLGALRALTRVPGAALWDVIFLVPFLIPPYIAALSWAMTLQPGGYMQQLTGMRAGGFLFSYWGIVFVMVLNVFPVVYFAVSRTMATVGGSLASVARVSGASQWRSFFSITLPLSIPGIAAGLLVVFALTIEEYGTPATLGTQAGYEVLVTAIHRRFSDWPIDMPGAAVLSLILVIMAMVAFYFQHWLVNRRSYTTVSGKSRHVERVSLGRWQYPVLGLFALVAIISVVIPIAAVIATSFASTISRGLTMSNFSWRHYQTVFENGSGAMGALGTSISMATIAALITGILGALISYLVVRVRCRGHNVLDFLSLLPNTMPGIVVAVGLILAWNHPWWPFTVYNTGAMLVLAYCCLLLPYPVRYANACFQQVSPNLEAAALVSGAGFTRMFISIHVPILMPHLLVAMLLVFAIASRELVASLMVTPPGTQTVSTFVFGQFEQGSPGVGMAMSVIAIFSTTALLLAVTLFSRKRLEN